MATWTDGNPPRGEFWKEDNLPTILAEIWTALQDRAAYAEQTVTAPTSGGGYVFDTAAKIVTGYGLVSPTSAQNFARWYLWKIVDQIETIDDYFKAADYTAAWSQYAIPWHNGASTNGSGPINTTFPYNMTGSDQTITNNTTNIIDLDRYIERVRNILESLRYRRKAASLDTAGTHTTSYTATLSGETTNPPSLAAATDVFTPNPSSFSRSNLGSNWVTATAGSPNATLPETRQSGGGRARFNGSVPGYYAEYDPADPIVFTLDQVYSYYSWSGFEATRTAKRLFVSLTRNRTVSINTNSAREWNNPTSETYVYRVRIALDGTNRTTPSTTGSGVAAVEFNLDSVTVGAGSTSVTNTDGVQTATFVIDQVLSEVSYWEGFVNPQVYGFTWNDTGSGLPAANVNVPGTFNYSNHQTLATYFLPLPTGASYGPLTITSYPIAITSASSAQGLEVGYDDELVVL